MKPKILWAPLAIQDLIQIKDYIQKDNPSAAKQQAEKIRKSAEKLIRFPQSGQKVSAIPGVRQVLAGNYYLFYRIQSSRIEILRVYHTKRAKLIL